LTKIIVGVSLTQLGSIRTGAVGLFRSMAASLGGARDSAAFAGALTIYYATVGFILGWLATRLFLGPALTAADRRALDVLVAAALADEAGEPAEAAQLRREALDVLAVATPLAARYEELRRSSAPGAERTRAMEREIARARQFAEGSDVAPSNVRQAFLRGKDGDRIFAIGLMQGRLETADSELLADAVGRSRSVFEQHQALVVARALASEGRLNEEQRTQLREFVTSAISNGRIEADSDRHRLATEMLERLESTPA